MKNKSGLILVGCLLIGVLLVVGIWQWQEANNQIVHDPNAKPAPVVPQLPDLVGEMAKAKSLCESRGQMVISLKKKVPLKDILKAERLYGDTKGEFDGSITFLQTGLDRRFMADDPKKIADKLKLANDKMAEYLTWVDHIQNQAGGIDPLAAIIALLDNWMNASAKQNAEAIKGLKDSLEKCRLESWKKL
jgi:hypothetical protein